ncbi:sigma-54-dependent Fis family transcriptional regulator [Paludibacterium paludis]|uniref:Sigma-54-dependent Fis family transcriptional regulator n=1 Tax=Paludibacterium paludis TaxID=1225769 RepID=A0A918U9B0_9NEIS|nr:sigma-54-dependent Fis family transcriptional regulator [Paludibacterium paludis]GGY12714.1 sigma-54-dependent Fis family transcriptional regulator [Paludibacterium paludis]
MPPLTSCATLNEARRRFFEEGQLPESMTSRPILASWLRCREQGLTPERPARRERLEAARLAERLEENGDWLAVAEPHLDRLFEAAHRAGHVLVVADRDGLILQSRGHPDFLDKAERVNLTPGMDWAETSRGTNAIGTALAERQAVLVRGAEHYLSCNRALACLARPILAPSGHVLGILDISGLPSRLGRGLARLINQAAESIEAALFDTDHPAGQRLVLPAGGASDTARLAFDDEGRLCAATSSALARLGLDTEAIGQATRETVFRLPASPLQDDGRVRSGPRADTAAAPDGGTAAGLPDKALSTCRKLLEADIPVLLLGETGTGKERMARALHGSSRRRGKPFVAINCAAIPESLAEAELFGYVDGAFTGARRQGNPGRLCEADGGILFLDEIGDMPLALQARLLRVLQDREVVPLGGGRPRKTDFRLIAATHRDLPSLVESGAFRADLYYRLCHYPVALPALRERGDLREVALRLFAEHGAWTRRITVSDALLEVFARHSWPGNLREMDNLARTLVALAEDGARLTPEDLPFTFSARPKARHSELEACLARHGGNVSRAARELGVSRSTLYRRRAGQNPNAPRSAPDR